MATGDEINPEHGEAFYNLSRQLAQSDPDESKRLHRRFEAVQAQKQIMDRAQTLGNSPWRPPLRTIGRKLFHNSRRGSRSAAVAPRLASSQRPWPHLPPFRRHKEWDSRIFEAKKLTPADPDIDKAIRIAQTAEDEML